MLLNIAKKLSDINLDSCKKSQIFSVNSAVINNDFNATGWLAIKKENKGKVGAITYAFFLFVWIKARITTIFIGSNINGGKLNRWDTVGTR